MRITNKVLKNIQNHRILKCKVLVNFTDMKTELERRMSKANLIEVNAHNGAIVYSSKLIFAFGVNNDL